MHRRVCKLGSRELGETISAAMLITGAGPNHISMALFLLPRGIDRIINARELRGTAGAQSPRITDNESTSNED